MKISIKPIFEYEKTEAENPKTFQDYQWRLELVRTRLHCRYLVLIAVICCIWLVAVKTGTNGAFAGQVSFAATITSIILSVIAIWMSISGETKMTAVRNQMEETAGRVSETTEQMEETAGRVSETTGKMEETAGQLSEATGQMEKTTGQLSEATGRMEKVNDAIQAKLEEKLNQLDKVCEDIHGLVERTENLGADIGVVKQSVEALANTAVLKTNGGKGVTYTADQFVDMYERMFLEKSLFPIKKQVKQIVEYVLAIFQLGNDSVSIEEVFSYVGKAEEGIEKGYMQVVWQRIYCLCQIGLRGNREAQDRILQIVREDMPHSTEAIKEHHARYQETQRQKNVSSSGQ